MIFNLKSFFSCRLSLCIPDIYSPHVQCWFGPFKHSQSLFDEKKSVNQKCFFLLLIFNYLFKRGNKSVSRENIEYDWAQFLLTGNSFECEFHKAKFNHSPLIPPLSQPAERERERERENQSFGSGLRLTGSDY